MQVDSDERGEVGGVLRPLLSVIIFALFCLINFHNKFLKKEVRKMKHRLNYTPPSQTHTRFYIDRTACRNSYNFDFGDNSFTVHCQGQRKQPNRVVCMSNQKAIGVAFQYYVGDYRCYPPLDYDYINGWSGWGGEDTWKNILINEGYVGDEDGDGPLLEWGNGISEGALKYFMCPGSSQVKNVRLTYGDYVYNTARSTSNPTGWPHAGCSMADPNDFITPLSSLGVIADGRPISFL